MDLCGQLLCTAPAHDSDPIKGTTLALYYNQGLISSYLIDCELIKTIQRYHQDIFELSQLYLTSNNNLLSKIFSKTLFSHLINEF